MLTETRGLNSANLEPQAELVHNQNSQSLAVDVLGDNQQGRLLLQHMLEHGQDLLYIGNLLVAEENVRVVEFDLHVLHTSHEVGRDVTLVPLHSLDYLKLVLQSLALDHRDGALLADLLHGVGDKLADNAVSVCRNGGHIEDLVAGGHLLLNGIEVLHNALYGHVDTAKQVHGVQTGIYGTASSLEDGASQHRSRSRTITGLVVGVRRHLAHQLGAKILQLVRKLNGFGDSDTVFRDLRRSVWLCNDNVASLGTQSHRHGVYETVHTAEKALTTLDRVLHFFRKKATLCVKHAACQLSSVHHLLQK
ncbi:dNA polymerase II large subunit, putative [Babesia ovata]|uniref:DNA polymerase II large subunit, putative n=1 Tax=Babesia ovata TaxID=189622 RepID=A0A2H6KH25_9APIC|nr:dNA polymerase II large subunit, putative [Babesia ovata]GBE62281.1 dNA polymerase II large subunit, putative [Babesia ovata]